MCTAHDLRTPRKLRRVFYELTLNRKFLMNKWGIFSRKQGHSGYFEYFMRCENMCVPVQIGELVFQTFTVNEVFVTAPCYQLEIYYSNKIATYACQTCLRGLRVVEIKKKAALCTDNLKNISVLSSAAYVTKLKRFSSVTLYGYIEFWKIQLVNENISRPSTRAPGASRRALSFSSIPGDRPEQ